MSRQKKEYDILSLKLDKTVSTALTAMSKETGIPKTTIIEKSAMEYITRYNNTGRIRPEKD